MNEYTARTAKQLGAILRGYRRDRGLTQRALGEGAGFPQSAVSQIESDPTTTSLCRIYRVLSVLGLELVVRPRGEADGKTDW